MRGGDGLWQNAANERIVGVDGVEGLDCAILLCKDDNILVDGNKWD